MKTSHLTTIAFLYATALLPADELLIGPGLRNGSFESEQTKQTSWDTVSNWQNWDSSVGGPSTANNDSGVEPGGSHGNMGAFMQPDNAVYNLTEYTVQVGDEFDIVFDKLDTDSMQVALVYENDSGQIAILPDWLSHPTSITTGTQTGTLRLARVDITPDNSPAGRRIGIGIINKSGAFPNFDNFKLIRRTAGDRYYVDAARSGQGNQDGSSWATAFASLPDALLLASSGDEVWVREGIYYPDEAEAGIATVTADDSSVAFEIVSGVSLYGGFDGTETELSQRDTSSRATILSGDITQDDNAVDGVILDDPASNIVGTNSQHIINSTGGYIDGFTITAAQIDAAYTGTGTLRRLLFQGNLGSSSGAASLHGTPRIIDCAFINNEGGDCGAIYIGGGSVAVIDRCTFRGNRTTYAGGYSAGAVRIDRGTAEIRNSGFSGNAAGGKGAILATGTDGVTTPLTLINCTIAGNKATWSEFSGVASGGVGVFEGASIAAYNSVIWGNSALDSVNADGLATIESCLIEGLNPGGSNLDGTDPSNDPRFFSPIAGSSAPNNSGDYQLAFNSPLISAGNASYLPLDSTDSDEDGDLGETSPLDLNAAARIQGALDIGAYELDSLTGLAYFRASYGLNPDGSDDSLDWSKNGIANLLYFAFGLGDPNEANIDRSRLPSLSADNGAGSLTFRFVRPADPATGIELLVKTSADLATWSTPDDLGIDYLPVSEEIDNIGDGFQRVTQTYDLMPGETGRYYRVEVGEFSGL